MSTKKPTKKAASPQGRKTPVTLAQKAESVARTVGQATTLKQMREGIDALDDLLLSLLSTRARLAQEAGRLKTTKTPLDPAREAQVLARLVAANVKDHGPLKERQLKAIFREVISACRELQEPLSVAFLGPLGSFSHEAALQVFGQSVQTQPKTTFSDAVQAVATGAADFALVPVENTTEGVVAATLDALEGTQGVQVYGEHAMAITQHLLGKGPLEKATKLATFHQPLGQCRRWHQSHGKHLEVVPTGSSATAAQMAAKDPRTVAIGSALAAEVYGLDILTRNIQDHANNQTRFLMVSRETPPVHKGAMKTSLALTLKHEPGSLAKLLSTFSGAGINLTFIESRPVQGVLYEYRFFVDFLGDGGSKALAPVMKKVQAQAKTLRVLGVYPAGAG